MSSHRRGLRPPLPEPQRPGQASQPHPAGRGAGDPSGMKVNATHRGHWGLVSPAPPPKAHTGHGQWVADGSTLGGRMRWQGWGALRMSRAGGWNLGVGAPASALHPTKGWGASGRPAPSPIPQGSRGLGRWGPRAAPHQRHPEAAVAPGHSGQLVTGLSLAGPRWGLNHSPAAPAFLLMCVLWVDGACENLLQRQLISEGHIWGGGGGGAGDLRGAVCVHMCTAHVCTKHTHLWNQAPRHCRGHVLPVTGPRGLC